MSGVQPVALYAMKVPPGDIMVPAVPEFAAMFRLTMAAIDPSAEPELEDPDDKRPARATLKLIRVPDGMLDEDDDDDDDEDYLAALEDDDEEDDEDDEDEDDEEVNGGPSEKKSKASAGDEDDDDDEDMEDEDDEDDDDEDAAAIARLTELMKSAKGKGKAKALEGEDDADDEEDEDDEALEMDEVVICTLDPEKNCQQPLDFVVGEGEKIFFKVSGAYTVNLTGNYVIPQDDVPARLYDEDEDDEELDYDLSPDEDELDALEDADEESDDLDDLKDPRIKELDEDDEVDALKAIKMAGKGKNKRPAEDDEDDEEEDNLDDIVAKSLKKEESKEAAAPEKLSKAEKKRLKKLKKNDGEAVAVGATEGKKDTTQTNGSSSEKKVQFAKNLEQGPTPSATPPTSSAKSADSSKEKSSGGASLGVKEVQGVTVDDRKLGSGPAAKKGSRLEMRYIGKLDNGKVFDSNKSGKPFSFKLGAGEVIKGWDIGLQGIQVGGERRLVIPAHLAYGNKALSGIPKNSRLTFDIKCLAVK
ncbi:uncharacterized protein Z520_05602 [Fonsecaea multimorphosa CBS 102226]|uniref:peptidylprolyl isomerase n=1 Tax=Fonsecaea multimorphosa CBS 102226 TaxID=1442371 RepID=A0A0D2IMN0_9EURO|nr:uncharacterized protein Z520_05602 [Fonsecaea multimorphosa CBS 102226]KIX98301.1 hypothetical protein Z520_05602 [Fonsecaea multimorphosa CBS 102226]OAL24497.1 hypothetical protein AYO22_05286 [Fonsecaea multimorphosa]